MDKAAEPWRVPVAVEDIPDSGLHVELEAPETVRTAIASAAELRTLPELKASFDVTRRGKAVHVGGTVEAIVGQTCVVTLEPIENRVAEEVDLLFSPDAPAVPEPAEGESLAHSADEEEPPEPLVGGVIDLGAVATEFLMLGIDPYPRKDGAEFANPAPADEGAHPFAALAALKRPPRGS